MEYINKNLVFEIVKGVLNLLIEEDKVKSLLPKISNDAPKIYEGFMSNLSDLYKFANNEYKDKIVNVVLDNIALDNLIEVKEVDLDTEIAKWEESFKHSPASMGYKETAKHFFELGLNVSNLVTWRDMAEIDKIASLLEIEWLNNTPWDGIRDCGFYAEVLKRFKAQKGGEVWKTK